MRSDRDIKKRGKLYTAEVLIPNKKGLHARASAQFVRTASKYPCEIRVSRDGNTVGGTSIMGLMMLGAAQGQTVTLEAEGDQAREAMHALMDLIEDKFGEGE